MEQVHDQQTSSEGYSPPRPEAFLPGTVFAGRYRIVTLLGRGAMGEVYRADDLKLGQPVALKFLPERLQSHRRLERFVNEVKLARRVAHPNVCRVYDVQEVDGHHFLAMEYIDGEDLACLLRRIERLPKEKALQIAAQLCAGLAAIHAEGILHRDLKPANVMLDSRGQVRITDFGLAGLAGQIKEGETCGTPQYMSPEQLSGQEVSARSDIYALGLVLFETFTGHKVFSSAAQRLEEKFRLPEVGQAAADLDPAVENVIVRCLAAEPGDRPGSAIAVLAELPAGDPLKTLVMSGQTPLPEVVAAASGIGRIGWRVGGALTGVILAGTLLIALGADHTMLFRMSRLDKPPEVLAHRGDEILRSMGYADSAADTAYGFGNDIQSLIHLTPAQPRALAALRAGRLNAMYFWYRRDSSHLAPHNLLGRVSALDPPFYSKPGAISLVLDPQGRLLELRAVPPDTGSNGGISGFFDWADLFADAGLDFDRFRPSTPRWIPPMMCDAYGAWEGSMGEDPGTTAHVEAGAFAGRPVFFRMETPWSGSILEQVAANPQFSNALYNVLYLLVIVACVVQLRPNLRQGRGDRTGARRLALYILIITLLQWLLRSNHAAHLAQEIQMLIKGVGLGLYKAIVLCWIPYIALEPLIRRRWPETIVSWSRLLAGRFRDPLVGRDLLIGLCGAVLLQIVIRLYYFVPNWLSLPPPQPKLISPDTLLGPRFYLSEFLAFQEMAVFYGFALLFLLLAAQILLRRDWLAATVVVGLVTAMWWEGELSKIYPLLIVALTAVRMAAFVLILKRWGLLALIIGIFFDNLLNTFPITLALSEWYAENSVFTLTAVLGIGAYACYTALGRYSRHPLALS